MRATLTYSLIVLWTIVCFYFLFLKLGYWTFVVDLSLLLIFSMLLYHISTIEQYVFKKNRHDTHANKEKLFINIFQAILFIGVIFYQSITISVVNMFCIAMMIVLNYRNSQ